MGRKASISAAKILDTAEDIIIDKGAARLTFENIAHALGITKGGVQYSFASKDAIIEQLINRWINLFDIEMAEHMPENPTPSEYIRAHIKATHATVKTSSKGASLMVALLDNSKFKEIARDWYQKRLKALAELSGSEQKRLQVAFWACEGVFLLSSFGLVVDSANDWNDIFTNIDNAIF